MEAQKIVIVQHLLVALLAGGLIGLERSYHGRPAGFRTHALVCLASSALMLVAMHHVHWFPAGGAERVSLDPTRLAQGIMTGIGFLGAGVIFKEGLTVRGLTTAASIWITAAIGILAGIGLYFSLIVTTALTLGTLSLFRWIEARMPYQFYARLEVRLATETPMPEEELRRFIADHGFSISNLSTSYDAAAKSFAFGMMVKSTNPDDARRLPEALRTLSTVQGFQLVPMGD